MKINKIKSLLKKRRGRGEEREEEKRNGQIKERKEEYRWWIERRTDEGEGRRVKMVDKETDR